jgi:CheY-like chemotaxis protein
MGASIINNNNPTAARIKKILLVDDDQDVIDVLKRGVELESEKKEQRLQVNSFSSPREALKSFEPGVFDLAIIDIRMPGMNGFELYRELRALDRTITICFLSAFEMHEEFKKLFPSMSDSIKTIIQKPITAQRLLKEIQLFLKMS